MPQTHKRQASAMQPTASAMSIAQAKANFSSVITTVQQKHGVVTILRRGVPVAQIVPFPTPEPASGYGWMRGTVQELGDIVGPTGVEWTAGDE
jgi:prevent-host-death family protein